MPTVRLGRTGLTSDKNAFGALPIQRVSFEEAALLLHKAFENGITYFDTARSYSDSEEKIGRAMSGLRHRIILATKTHAKTVDQFWADLHRSLELLQTDYIDIYQFHNPAQCYRPGDGTGMYEAMQQAKQQGKIRFIGASNHRRAVAREIAESGLYDTLQFPFCYLADEQDEALVRRCRELDVGFICMKALSGGLIQDYRAAYAYIAGFDNALPIWGIQRERELNEFIGCISNPPVMTDELRAIIARDRKELSGSFCRGCGYCLPCPAGIDIPTAARMTLLLGRAPVPAQLTPARRENMDRINQCIGCRHCADHCPYGLDTPALLRENLAFYQDFISRLS